MFLTWLRIAAIPLFIAVLYIDESWLTSRQANIIATVIFVVAAITAPAAPAAPEPTTRRAFLTWTGDADRQATAIQFLAVKHFNRPIGLLGGVELDEGKAPGFAGELVEHQVDVGDPTGSAEMVLQIAILSLKGQITDKQPRIGFHNFLTAPNALAGTGTCRFGVGGWGVNWMPATQPVLVTLLSLILTGGQDYSTTRRLTSTRFCSEKR